MNSSHIIPDPAEPDNDSEECDCCMCQANEALGSFLVEMGNKYQLDPLQVVQLLNRASSNLVDFVISQE